MGLLVLYVLLVTLFFRAFCNCCFSVGFFLLVVLCFFRYLSINFGAGLPATPITAASTSISISNSSSCQSVIQTPSRCTSRCRSRLSSASVTATATAAAAAASEWEVTLDDFALLQVWPSQRACSCLRTYVFTQPRQGCC